MTTQQAEALKLANTIRLANACLRRHLHTQPTNHGLNVIADIIDPDADTDYRHGESLRVSAILTYPRRVGVGRRLQLMRFADIRTGERRVCDLTDRQRRALAGAIRGYVAEHPSGWNQPAEVAA